MNLFSEKLTRLKKQLGVSKDQEIAEKMGFGKTAFSERKKRNSFPEKELRSLAQEQPELGVDIEYVLTGKSAKTQSADWLKNFPARLAEVRGARSYVEFAPLMGATAEEVMLMEAGERQPTSAQFIQLVESHPTKSAAWLAGSDAPKLDRQLDQLETILIANYRASSEAGQDALRHHAAYFADYNNKYRKA